MGTCHETRADRTRFIINEDFRIKQSMLKTLQNYTKNQQNQPVEICEKKNYRF